MITDKKQNKSKVLVLCLFWILSLVLGHFAYAAKTADLEPIRKEDKILILAPHPDDEAIACAGIIQEAVKIGAQVKIVYLTNGDHNQLAFIVYEKRLVFRKGEFIHMGEVRRREAQKAMSYLGLKADNLIFLGYPDFGTFTMATKYWKSPRPFKSLLTRMTKVPYPDNFSYQKAYLPQNILLDLEKIIEAYKPNKIFVSHPADINGDHRACSLFLNVALWDLEGRIPQPRIYAYMVHHFDWPLPRKYHPALDMVIPEDLKDLGAWSSFVLAPEMVEKKYNAIREYKSQTESSGFYLFAFARGNELFQEIPVLEVNVSESARMDAFVEYVIEGNYLDIIFQHPVDNYDISRVSMYLFGWRKDTAFADMPKLFLKISPNAVSILDGRKRIDSDGMRLVQEGPGAMIRIPLGLLNYPEKALISTRIFSKSVPYVQGIWSGVKLNKSRSSAESNISLKEARDKGDEKK